MKKKVKVRKGVMKLIPSFLKRYGVSLTSVAEKVEIKRTDLYAYVHGLKVIPESDFKRLEGFLSSNYGYTLQKALECFILVLCASEEGVRFTDIADRMECKGNLEYGGKVGNKKFVFAVGVNQDFINAALKLKSDSELGIRKSTKKSWKSVVDGKEFVDVEWYLKKSF